ncbi:YczE/YyaS/YitT family protein [Desulfobacter curvatus]|uniref:YczE/YyaS/YitT family protein n=1 Tax=Desulfobacter curvatus TaxID=2290 RepID=UPI00035D5218|nr:DUF6198 family protein [Desulfobacter curvatus]
MKQNILNQSVMFIVGLFIMAAGVVFSVKADLGVSPISCVPYVFSLTFPLTLGQTTIILNVLLIFLQMLLLRKRYRIFQLVQFPVVFLFGFFIDLIMKYSDWIIPATYFEQAALCLLSCVVLGIGVFFEVKAALTYLPGEGLAMALTQTFGVEFGKTKIGTDSSLVVIGIASSLYFLGALEGIREGTVVAALLVGYIVRFLHTRFFLLAQWFKVRKKKITPLFCKPFYPSSSLRLREHISGRKKRPEHIDM